MEAFTIEMQSVFVGFTLNAVMLFATYFASSYRCSPGGALASARGATLSYAKCFAAGILLGTLFVALMPTVRASVNLALKHHKAHTVFPVAEALILAGFCITLYIEHMLFAHKTILPSPSDSGMSLGSAHGSRANLLQGSDSDIVDRPLEDPFPILDPVTYRHDSASPVSRRPRMAYRMTMLVFCMAVHSVLEGLTLGLQVNLMTVLRLLIRVYVHEFLVLLALGLCLGGSGLPVCTVVRMGLTLAAMVPFGQVLGLTFGSDVGHTGRAVAQALTAGTFFHVLFDETLPSELGSFENRLPKVTSLIVGFAFMAATSFATNLMLVNRV
ncbi:unnamed protein product [Ixodes hexagonus]